MEWIRFGDKNTKFFHASNLVRWRRNRIDALKDECGAWVDDGEQQKTMVMEYYSGQFRMDGAAGEVFLKGAFPNIGDEICKELGKECHVDEVKLALRGMGSYKAPGPGGYQAIFFKST